MNFEQLSNREISRIKLEVYNRLYPPEQHTEENRNTLDAAFLAGRQAFWNEELPEDVPDEAARQRILAARKKDVLKKDPKI